jgi:hypothetical protein
MSAERLARINRVRDRHRQLMKSERTLSAQLVGLSAMDMAAVSAHFFTNAQDMRAKAARILERCPQERKHIVEIAANVLSHRFDLLGAGLQDYGFPLQWNRDYSAGHEWPKGIDLLAMGRAAFDIVVDKTSAAEIKAPWDLSNMHWIPSLVSAFYLTGESRYIDHFVADTTDWLRENQPFLGVNWFCPMNIAMRAANLIVGLTAFYPFLEKKFTAELVASLFRHGVVTMAYLEVESGERRNNHYLTNLVGMYFLGMFFQDTELGREWLGFAKEELETEAAYQFYDDGVTFEDSSSYHRLSVEMLLYAAILARDNQDDFSQEFHQRLHRGLRFTRDLQQANHTIPQFGDNDNGRLLQFYGYSTAAVTDHRHLLALGGEFFADDLLRFAGRGAEPEAIWALGDFCLGDNQPEAAPSLTVYGDSQYYILKDPQTTLVVRNGRINPYCGGGHAHCDQLSFTLNAKGDDIFVDPGAYRYSSDFQARNDFRSVEYHNTVQVNQSPMHCCDRETFEGLWWMSDGANAETLQATFTAGTFEFCGQVHAYEESDGCTVGRALTCNLANGELSVSDTVATSAKTPDGTRAFSRFLVGPGIDVERAEDGTLTLMQAGRLVARFRVENVEAEVSVRPLWFSPRYGERVRTSQIIVSWSPAEQATLTTDIQWDR